MTMSRGGGRIGTTLAVPIVISLGLATGLLREMILAFAFGADIEVEVFRVAYALPSIMSEAAAVSIMSGFIAVLAAKGRKEGLRRTIWAAFVLGCLIALAGALTMPLQAKFLAPGFSGEAHDTLIHAGRISWLFVALIMLSYPIRALLSLDGKILSNSMGTFLRGIFFVGIFVTLVTAYDHASAVIAASAAALTGLPVLLVYIWIFGKHNRRNLVEAFVSPPRYNVVFGVISAQIIVISAQILSSGGRLIDRLISSTLETGVLASVEYSYAITMAMAAVIGTSANFALVPAATRAFSSTRVIPKRLWLIVASIASGATIVGIIAAWLAEPTVQVIYSRGAFGDRAVNQTSTVFSVQMLWLGCLVGSLLLVQFLIVTGGQKWFFVVASTKLVVKVGSVAILLNYLGGIQAVAWSFGITEAGGIITLVSILNFRNKQSNA